MFKHTSCAITVDLPIEKRKTHTHTHTYKDI